jgi:hypothetical protein
LTIDKDPAKAAANLVSLQTIYGYLIVFSVDQYQHHTPNKTKAQARRTTRVGKRQRRKKLVTSIDTAPINIVGSFSASSSIQYNQLLLVLLLIF